MSDSIYFLGKNQFEVDTGTQKFLIFQPLCKYF